MPPVVAVLTQTASRGRFDDGSETSALWRAGANLPFLMPDGGNFRYRVQIGNGGPPGSTKTYGLQYSADAGATWVNITTSSAIIKAVASLAGIADDTATTNQLGVPGAYGAGFVAGSLQTNDAISASISLNPGQFTEIEWTLQLVAGSLAKGSALQFRAYPVGTVIDAWLAGHGVAMGLGPRQVELYTDVMNVYRGTGSGSDDDALQIISTIPHLNAIPGHLESTPNYDQNTSVGMSKMQDVFTSDRVHMEAGQDVVTGDLIVMTTPGKPYVGYCIMVTGVPQVKSWRAGKQMIYGKRANPPSSLASFVAGLS